MNYKLDSLTNKIHLLSFEREYDLCMFFLRYQEYYESPNKKFRNHAFQIVDFMDWYSNQKGKKGVFSYTIDWGGFNIPSRVIDEIIALGIPDVNKYDREMIALHEKLKSKSEGSYYLIGVAGFGKERSTALINHELAHGLYSTISEYKKEMDILVDELPKKIRKEIDSYLKKTGYTKEVFVDETQAYLSTGFDEEYDVYMRPFIKVFEKYKLDAVKISE